MERQQDDGKKLEASSTKKRTRFYSAGESAGFLGWDVQNVSADTAIYANLNKVKARCRDLARNNDYVRNAIRTIISNVVGPDGYRLQCKHRCGEGADKEFNRRIERAWVSAGKIKNSPTVCAKLSRIDSAQLWWQSLLVDGEVIEVDHPAFTGNKYRYATQFVDSARLDWRLNKNLSNGHAIRMGVEVDALGKPVAYWFLNNDPTEYIWGHANTSAEHTRVPAERVRHTFIQESIGQTRGIPQIASPAVRAHMLQRFEEAVVVGARVAASKVGFYTTTDDYQGEAPGDEDDEYQLSHTHEPGTFDMLPRGVEVQSFDPSSPQIGCNEFSKSMLKGVASGIIGADYVSMANDLEGVNYSSIRAGQLEQRSIYKALQKFYMERCLEPQFERWLNIQLFNADVQLDSRKVTRLLMDECYRFIGRGWTWVDPLKEVKAYGEAIDRRLTSRRRIVAETLGEDYDELLDEIEEDEKALSARGLLMAVVNGQQVPVEADEEEVEE